MTFIINSSKVREIVQTDSDFNIVDGIVVYPRAMIQIAPDCPATIRSHIQWAVDNGYLKNVAYMYNHELTFDKLKEI